MNKVFLYKIENPSVSFNNEWMVRIESERGHPNIQEPLRIFINRIYSDKSQRDIDEFYTRIKSLLLGPNLSQLENIQNTLASDYERYLFRIDQQKYAQYMGQSRQYSYIPAYVNNVTVPSAIPVPDVNFVPEAKIKDSDIYYLLTS